MHGLLPLLRLFFSVRQLKWTDLRLHGIIAQIAHCGSSSAMLFQPAAWGCRCLELLLYWVTIALHRTIFALLRLHAISIAQYYTLQQRCRSVFKQDYHCTEQQLHKTTTAKKHHCKDLPMLKTVIAKKCHCKEIPRNIIAKKYQEIPLQRNTIAKKRSCTMALHYKWMELQMHGTTNAWNGITNEWRYKCMELQMKLSFLLITVILNSYCNATICK